MTSKTSYWDGLLTGYLQYTQIKSWNIYFFFVVLLDFHKLDEWEVIIESDLKTMEWEDSEDSEGKNFNK